MYVPAFATQITLNPSSDVAAEQLRYVERLSARMSAQLASPHATRRFTAQTKRAFLDFVARLDAQQGEDESDDAAYEEGGAEA